MKRDRIIRFAVAALTLALAAALIASATALYRGGLARREASGSLTAPIFTRDDAGLALRRLAPLALAWLAVAGVSLMAGVRAPKGGAARASRDKRRMKGREETKRIALFRGALYALAALLLILGALNGGLNDVLVRVINICTECIGLG